MTPRCPHVDHEVLSGALRACALPADFAAITEDYVGRFSHDIWRLTLDNGVSLIVKARHGVPRPGERADVETAFYQRLAHTAGTSVPRFVGMFDGALCLEWVEAQPFRFDAGASAQHADAIVDTLAEWHARHWRRCESFDWLPSFADATVLADIQHSYDDAWSRQRTRLVDLLPEFAPIGDAMVGKLAGVLAPMAAPSVVLHGDAHAENLPLRDAGAVVMLDWQDAQAGHPGLDLAVFLTMSFPVKKRRAAEKQLLHRYTRQLAAAGCHWPEVHNGYRLGLLRRAARIVEIASDEFISLPWVFRRSALAAIDHHVEELLD